MYSINYYDFTRIIKACQYGHLYFVIKNQNNFLISYKPQYIITL